MVTTFDQGKYNQPGFANLVHFRLILIFGQLLQGLNFFSHRPRASLRFFTALVAYRNQVMGHGSQRQRGYYDKMGPALLESLLEVLSDQSLLGGFELAVARLGLDPTGTETNLSWQVLQGLGSLVRQIEDMQPFGVDLREKCVPGQVYLIKSGLPIPLHPLVVFVEDDLGLEHVGFLNRTIRRTRKTDSGPIQEVRRVDYLDYTTGEDLAAVIETALQRKPEDRYQTAQALANDLLAFSKNRPVSAKRFSRFHYLKLFARRNKMLVSTVALSLLLILLILAGSAFWNLKERQKAEKAAQRAEKEAQTARQVSDFLAKLFEIADPDETRGKTVTAKELLDQGAQKLEQELKDQPHIQARLKTTIGGIYKKLGLYDQAEPLFESALAQNKKLFGEQHLTTATSFKILGSLYLHQGRYNKAEKMYEHALRIKEKLLGSEHSEIAGILDGLGLVYNMLGKKAKEYLDKCLETGNQKIFEFRLARTDLAALNEDEAREGV
ncbi:tetratricopeptide repeat protein [candidate division CSSED10-310 bacterium]|uniref:Tetratricopeptide repeat protein n=1 Tax=candidate division CSSED10-310 bacterium TaxID=2855610 RepID=A0ABV6YWV1_UNCC1